MPLISVVICTYNREKYIGQALESIKNQSLPSSEYEVIVIDNNSADRSADIIKSFLDANASLPFRYFLEKQQGLSHARNAGIEHSNSQIICFIDDDAIAGADFLEKTVSFFEQHPDAGAVGGKVIPRFIEGEPVWLSRYVRKLVSEIDFGPKTHILKGRRYPFGANMSFRSAIFAKYGKFNPELGRKGKNLMGGEEKDMFDRMKSGGENIYYDPDIPVWHIIDPNRLTEDYLRRFCRGVGVSERVRLKEQGVIPYLIKWTENKAKRMGSLMLGTLFYLKGQPAKAKMIIDVMRWIEEGYDDTSVEV